MTPTPAFPPFVDVEVTVKDHVAYGAQLEGRRPCGWRRWVINAAQWVLILTSLGGLVLVRGGARGFVVLILAAYGTLVGIVVWTDRKAVQRLDGWHSAFKVWITHDGLHDAGSRAQTFYPWAGLQGVQQTPGHVFVWVSPLSGISCRNAVSCPGAPAMVHRDAARRDSLHRLTVGRSR